MALCAPPGVDIRVRRATAKDKPALTRFDPDKDPEYFVDRLKRQQAGRGILLVAWRNRQPVGNMFLWLDVADEPEIQENLPGVPLLQRARVVESLRGLGIGTKMMMEAEEILKGLGLDRVALAVEPSNVDALRLYTRLGYQDWGYGPVSCVPRKPKPGHKALEVEWCLILEKRLDANETTRAI